MATHDEITRMLQAQFVQWQEAATAQMRQFTSNMQAQMQAQFDQRVAELTRIREDGDGRKDGRDDHL